MEIIKIIANDDYEVEALFENIIIKKRDVYNFIKTNSDQSVTFSNKRYHLDIPLNFIKDLFIITNEQFNYLKNNIK